MVIGLAANLLAGLPFALFAYYLYKKRQRTPFPLPPGPKGYPFIGNVLDLPSKAIWEKFHEWCKYFGSDVIYINIIGQHFVILNSAEAAMDLLEKRSSIYSSRPRAPMLNELMGFDFNIGLAPYGDRWRAQRKMAHQIFHPGASKKLQPHIEKATHSLLRRFVEKPNEVAANLRHMAGESIMAVTYGLEVKPENDPYLEISEAVNSISTAVVPGAFLVDAVPVLKYVPEWMPGAGFQKKAREWKEVIKKMRDIPFAASKRLIGGGNHIPSLVSRCYSHVGEKDDIEWEEYLIRGTAASMYAAGSDTMSSTMTWCIIAVLNHPDILGRAQKEIDANVPFGELPTFDDVENKLPLVTAICMEVMRWREITPIGVPHMLTEDDVYNGYRIPKGAIVVSNIWGMLHDEAVYPDSYTFNPDRFLKDGKIDKSARDPSHASFGFGRRICPARFMAFSTIRMVVASMIAAFDIAKRVDENGNVVDVPTEGLTETLLWVPKPFTCSIKPRSEKHEQAIRSTLFLEYAYEW